MYLFWILYFDFIKLHSIIIVLLLLFSLLLNIWFPNEAFAMEPNITMDYYGQKEYTGPDPYGYFHNPIKDSYVSPIVDTNTIKQSSQDLYGVNPPYERDWYANNHINVKSPLYPDTFTFDLYISIKRRAYWYIWKIHSTEYNNYKDFKQAWNPKNSIRKDFVSDIKNAFLKRK
jgi:hypothetical protein